MENQHRKITGYRELSELEIGLMNEIKAHAEACGALVAKSVQQSDRMAVRRGWLPLSELAPGERAKYSKR